MRFIAAVPPLPNPADLAVKRREQASTIAEAKGARLLFVSSLEDGMVVLNEADGTIIDEPIPWMGTFDPVVGMKVIRLTVPGRGSKHAAPAYVAIGPVKASVPVVPTATVGAAMGTSPGAMTVSGTDRSGTIIQNPGTSTAAGVLWTVTFATPKANATYRPQVTNLSSTAADAVTYITTRTTTGFNIAARNAPGASQMAVVWFIPEVTP